MNSRERFETAMNMGEPDIVPVAPMVNVPHASKVLGVKPWEYVTDNKLYVEGQLKALEEYGYDWIFNHQPIQGVTEEERRSMRVSDGYVVLTTQLGTKLKIPLEGGPAVVEPGISDYSTLDNLEVPEVTHERMSPLVELLRRTRDKVYVCSKVPAPFHYAAEWMRGMENFMFDLVTRPEDAHRLLDFMSEVAIEVGKAQIDVGTHGIMMEDPSAACQVISKEHYLEFAYPYEKKVCSALAKYGGDVIIHICGDTTGILGDLANTGAKCLSIDESVSLSEARSRTGNKVALFGNVSVELIFRGSKRDIESKVKECIEGAGKRGYIVSSSCGLHSGTPFENLHVMVDSARKYGKC
jgi:uroporphyrinogen decarboxylase